VGESVFITRCETYDINTDEKQDAHPPRVLVSNNVKKN
jgi:hypothetical protein